MASESTIYEKVEPKVKEDEKATLEESVSSTKESGKENSKAEDSRIPQTASTETEAAENKQIDPPVAEAVDASELDEPKAEPDSSPASKENPEALSCQIMTPSEIVGQEDKLIEPPAVEVGKVVDAPVDAPKLDVLLAEENVVPNEIAEEKSITKNLKGIQEPLPQFRDLEAMLIEPPVVHVGKVVDAPNLDVLLAEDNVVSNEIVEKEKSIIENSMSLQNPLPEFEGLEAKLIHPPAVEVGKVVDAPKLDVLLAEENVVSNEIAKEKSITKNSKGIREPLLESGDLEAKLIEPPAVDVGKVVDAPKLDVLLAEDNIVANEIAEKEKFITGNSKSLQKPLLEFESLEAELIHPPAVEVRKAIDAPKLDVLLAEENVVSNEIAEEKSITKNLKGIREPLPESGDLEAKLIEPPAVDVGKVVDAPKLDVLLAENNVVSNKIAEKEKSITKNLKSIQEPLPEFGGLEAKLIEPPVVEVKKIVVATTLNAPVMDEIKVGKEEPINESEIHTAPESTTDTVKSLAEDIAMSKYRKKEEPKQPFTKFEGKEQDEKIKMVDALDPSAEANEKPKEQLDLTAAQESEVKVKKEHEDLESRSSEVEKQKTEGEEVEESPGKPLEHEKAEEKSDKLESVEKEMTEIVKDGESLADKVEHPALPEVTTSNDVDQHSTVEISEEVSVDRKTESDPKDEWTSPPSVIEKPAIEEEKKEIAAADTKNVESDNNEKSSAIVQDSTQKITDERLESVNRSVSTNAVTDNSIKDVARDDELMQENKTVEIIKDETPTLTESQRVVHKEKMHDEETETAVKETPAEYQPPAEFELKHETAKNDAPKSEGEQVENTAKSDANIELHAKDIDSTKPDESSISAETTRDEHKEEKQDEVTTVVYEPIKETEQPLSQMKKKEISKNIVAQKSEKEEARKSDEGLESSTKDGDNLKSSKDLPKQIQAKATQKQSNSIISKVKHSLLKAKKALIGKSPSSKTIVSHAKSDIEVK